MACAITAATCHLQGIRRDAQPCRDGCDLSPAPCVECGLPAAMHTTGGRSGPDRWCLPRPTS